MRPRLYGVDQVAVGVCTRNALMIGVRNALPTAIDSRAACVAAIGTNILSVMHVMLFMRGGRRSRGIARFVVMFWKRTGRRRRARRIWYGARTAADRAYIGTALMAGRGNALLMVELRHVCHAAHPGARGVNAKCKYHTRVRCCFRNRVAFRSEPTSQSCGQMPTSRTFVIRH